MVCYDSVVQFVPVFQKVMTMEVCIPVRELRDAFEARRANFERKVISRARDGSLFSTGTRYADQSESLSLRAIEGFLVEVGVIENSPVNSESPPEH
ncbi:hypothetical protein Pla100_53280 [Neorhodopirellula pilleata]|uniref:Uncharacterized protein n=1 Tax=Neorhodopirellula pilleata TaxID=2714738 RepID=A0A5C5ZWS4_9BACT|nr:hypothetical protein Pla100_52790 [Neorhodopirellula pilleata]TWT91478.1 hypothetical protein Pla100_53280 [Neorhodopirellula pilleata]